MLSGWLVDGPSREAAARWSDLAGLDLVALGTEAPVEDLTATDVAQPLLTVAAVLSAAALLELPTLLEPAGVASGARCDLVVGHSLGEIPALVVAGVLSADEAVVLAAARGRAMARAAALHPTGMVALLGRELTEAVELAHSLGLQTATVNTAAQHVVGGDCAALDALLEQLPRGVRGRRLATAGAFHTRWMAPAAEDFAAALDQVALREPVVGLVANADGAVVSSPQQLRDRLLTQLTSPVRFDLCLQTLADAGADDLVELAPGGTLAGLARKALPDATVRSLTTPADLPSAATVTS